MDNNLNLNDFDYKLNKRYISEYPCGKRDQSKLLIYRNDKIFNSNFFNLDSYIPDNSTIFLNNTRVINSRFYFINSTKSVWALTPRLHLFQHLCLNFKGQL